MATHEGTLISDFFGRQAALTPEARALGEWGWAPDSKLWRVVREVSFAELDAYAEDLAASLQKLGVGPEKLVALHAPRGIEAIVGLLAILKAGGAFLALDPDNPPERLQWMLADAAPLLLLSDGRHAFKVDATPTFSLPNLAEMRSGGRARRLAESADQLAFVIYTSGSTGRPKGVMGVHRGVINRMTWMWGRFPFRTDEVCAQKTALSFVDAIWEIFGPLSQGIPLALFATDTVREPVRLLEALAAAKVTRLLLTPSLLRAILATDGQLAVRLPHLTFWVSSGEVLPKATAAAFLQAHGDATLINLYGSSEVYGDVTAWEVQAGDREIPIGTPIQATDIRVLGGDFQATSPGADGQIYVAGLPLARGYLRRPAQTAATFLPDPWSAGPGERLYKTGDVGYLEMVPGDIPLVFYRGRADTQVNLRGFRIEPGEIEAALAAHPDVSAALVMVREHTTGPRLEGFVTVHQGGSVSGAALKFFIAKKVPDYMVPAVVVVLSEFPITPNGKVDRMMLLTLQGSPKPQRAIEAGGTVAQTVFAVWAEVLGLAEIGPDDHFFQLGGHSLLAVQVMARLNDVFAVDLQVVSLFDTPLAGTFAKLIEAALPQGSQVKRKTRVLPRPAEERGQLSFSQESLWFVDRMGGADAAYIIPVSYYLEGPACIRSLSEAIARIVARHAPLHTVFPERNGRPIAAEGTRLPELRLVDLRGLAERAAVAESLARRETTQPFKLALDPLFRAGLFRLDEKHHLLVLTLHHIISDGWSIGNLIEELSSFYQHALVETAPTPTPLATDYGEFAASQRARLTEDRLGEMTRYWKEVLNDAPPLITLPVDRPRPKGRSHRGGAVELLIDERLTASLLKLGIGENATLFMILLAAYSFLLHRLSGQDSVVVGVPYANRTRRDWEPLLGLFVNTVVLRTDFEPDHRFLDLLALVRQRLIPAFSNNAVPFEKLVEVLNPVRNSTYNPIFQVMFNLLNAPAGQPRLPLLNLQRRVGGEQRAAKFDLNLVLYPDGDALGGRLEYSKDLFDEATAARFADHYRNLLEALVNQPGLPLTALHLTTQQERAARFMCGEPDSRPFVPIQQWFREVALQRGPAPAMVFGDEWISYTGLETAANGLAMTLSAQTPEGARVGVFSEHPLVLAIGLLAVLKAGRIYVPLDPSLPEARLAGMIATAEPALFLCGQVHAGIPLFGRTPSLVVVQDGPGAAVPPQRSFQVDDPCTLFFTSGSTGRPKPILGRLGGIDHFIHWERALVGLTEVRGSQLAAPGFDAFLKDLFLPLCTGGVVCAPVDRQVVLQPASFVAWLSSARVTVLACVPSLFRILLSYPFGPGDLPDLAWVVLAGEALHPEDMARLQGHFGTRVRLLNLYGPTETTLTKFAHPVETVDASRRFVPLGKPAPGVKAALVEASGGLSLPGAVGEVLIHSPHASLGYWRSPELNRDSFINPPFDAERTYYKTGDLARMDPEGRLEFVGRADGQVKIRGVRIETGEIETLLLRHDQVTQAAVVVYTDQQGTPFLGAWVVAAEGLAASSLRAFLSEHLPGYMLPSLFQLVGALPLLPNGKINRRELAGKRVLPERQQEKTRNLVEDILVEIWKDMLKLNQVGRDDNFFELGGHSLLAAGVLSRIYDIFDIELPLHHFFEFPQIADCARFIEEERNGATRLEPLPPIEAGARGDHNPLSFAQQRLCFLEKLVPGSYRYNIPRIRILTGALCVGALESAIEDLRRRHTILRAEISERDGAFSQRTRRGVAAPLRLVDLRALTDEVRAAAVGTLVAAETRASFDLGRGHLLRVLLLVEQGNRFRLVLTLHHIAGDEPSFSIIYRELALFYAARLKNQAADLPELVVQYGDYARWQRAWLQGPLMTRRLAFWREQLQGAPPLLNLPLDDARRELLDARGGRVGARLSPELSAELDVLGRAHGATPFMTILTAFGVLLQRFGAGDDLPVAVPSGERRRAELESVIGFFVNTLVMRLDVSGPVGFAQLLERTRRTALDAFAHRELPFEKLVEALEPERGLDHAPLCQVMFVYRNADGRAPQWPGLKVAPSASPWFAARFDLTLSVIRVGDRFQLAWIYNHHLFQRETIERLSDTFIRLIEAMVAAPDRPVRGLPVFAPLLPELLIEETTPLDILGAIHQQAVQRGEATALISSHSGQTLDYGRLSAGVLALAGRLQAQGVGREQRVAVCYPAGLELIVASLAVLQVGAVLLLPDLNWPAGRLQAVLSGADHLLGAPDSLLNGREKARVLEVDGASGPPPSAFPEPVPQQLAYVLFTSGSTGTPNGVMVSRDALQRHCAGMYAHYALTARDCVLQFASPSFDPFFEQVLPALCAGARLVLRDEDFWDVAALQTNITRHEVTVVNLPPLLWREWCRWRSGGDKAPRLVVVGGDVMPPPERAADHELLNAYGPTEGVITATTYRLPNDFTGERVPIGTALPGRLVLVVDRFLERLPAGLVGQLCLGGPCLARGYLDDPRRTALRFVPDPFSGEPGNRLYLTGDLGREQRESGLLSLVGRLDRQVKLRGYRIEPAEVERALLGHPGVAEAAVMLLEGADGMARLTAFVVFAQPRPTPTALLQYLQDFVPVYAVTSVLIPLAQLPLNVAGKLDHNQLVSLAAQQPLEREEGEAPRGPREELLAEIWSELLGVTEIQREANFFHLGGDSIRGIQMTARARRAGLFFTLRDVFHRQTLAGLADVAQENPPEPTNPASSGAPSLGGDNRYPTTAAQRGMIYHILSSQQAPLYLEQRCLHLRGVFDSAAFAAAWAVVIGRHEGLRARFVWRGRDTPMMEILKTYQPEWRREAAPGLDEAAQTRRLAEYLEADRRRGFEMDQSPPMRFALINFGPEHTCFVWSFLHLLLDGWSTAIVLDEVWHVYATRGKDELSPPPSLAAYQTWRKRRDPAETETFWRAVLNGFEEPCLLTSGRFSSNREERRFSESSAQLSEADTTALRATAERLGVTPSRLFYGAWALVLAAYTGRRDLLFGATVSGRSPEVDGIEQMVGLFLHTVPLRLKLEPGARFGDWLVASDQGEHLFQDPPPLEKLAKWCGLPADTPLFDSLFVFQNTPGGKQRSSMKPAVTTRKSTARTGYPATVIVRVGRQARLTLINEDRRIGGSQASSLLAGMVSVLRQLSLDAGGRLGSYRVTDEAQVQQLLAWGRSRESGSQGCLHEPLSALARRFPTRPALRHGGALMTYGTLASRSERLAMALRHKGVRAETRVGVCLAREPELVVALFAVLRAGGAYVPLDPDLPPARLHLLVERAGVRHVIGDPARLSLPDGCEVITPDCEAEPIGLPSVFPDQTAYVLFTSGTTGIPKGVCISHNGAFRMVQWAGRDFSQNELGGMLALTHTTFDLSVFELFGSLCHGGTVILTSQPFHPEQIEDRAAIRLINTTPSAIDPERLARALPEGAFAVNLAGEPLPPSLAARLLALPQVTALRNLYGPTEATVYATVSLVDRSNAEMVPIGRPVAGASVYLLDPWMQLVPPGAVGRLWIGGGNLARGYEGAPAQTAEAFVPDPFAATPGARLYQTGDLARYDLDLDPPELVFLGRADHQLKLNGMRLEPEEVERALTAHPGVRAAGFRLVSGPERQIPAVMVVLHEGVVWDVAVLRAFLAERLPAHYIPAHWVAVASLPMTANGKLDRRALARLPFEEQSEPFAAPTSDAERVLCRVWAEVLGKPSIGVSDNFFELGGDSILALQITARAVTLGFRLVPGDLFRYQTVAELSGVSQRISGASPVAAVLPKQLPLTPIQHHFFAQNPVNPNHFNQAVTWETASALAPATLEAALAEVVELHVCLRLRLVGSGRARVLEPVAQGRPLLTVLDLGGLPEEARSGAYRQFAGALQASLDLARGRLVGAALVLDGVQSPRFLWVIHHLAVDAVSWRILHDDLVAAYRRIGRGVAGAFESRPSFAAWAAAQREAQARLDLDAERAYWNGLFRDAICALPADFDHGANTVASRACFTLRLDQGVTAAVLGPSSRAYGTRPLELMLAALARALHETTGQKRHVIHLEHHGRGGDRDLSGVVGWFTALYPARLAVGASLERDLIQTKEHLRELGERRENYGLFTYGLGERVFPEAQICFNYLGRLDRVGVAAPFLRRIGTAGPNSDPHNLRWHEVEVTAFVSDQQLMLNWFYSRNRHGAETITQLAERFQACLENVTRLCLQRTQRTFTPSDFPQAQLNEADLVRLSGVVAAEIEDVYPLTPMQEGMLFHTLAEPGSGVYVQQRDQFLSGSVDPVRFQQAWRELAARHDVLRTCFVWAGLERPMQVLLKGFTPVLTVVDALEWERLPEAVWRAQRARGLSLAEPPYRVLLCRVLDGWRFVFCYQHMLLDGWSLSLMMNELFSRYAALGGGTRATPAPAPPFRAYVAWARGRDRTNAERYWKKRLAGRRGGLIQPQGRNSDDKTVHLSLGHTLSEGDAARYRAFASAQRITPNILVRAAWSLLLSRLTGQADVSFAAIVSGRRSAPPEMINGVGLFINAVPARVRLQGNERMAAWLARCQEEQEADLDHGFAGLPTIRKWVGDGAELNCLFEFQNYPALSDPAKGSGVGLSAGGIRSREKTNFPLTLQVSWRRRPRLSLYCDPCWFLPAEGERLLAELAALLERITQTEGSPLWAAGPSEQERARLLRFGRGAEREVPELCVQDLVERAFKRFTGDTALVYDGAHFTFQELKALSDGFLHGLRQRGVGPESVVAVSLPRGPEMVAAILAVIRAGGAYLPLDPELPLKRRQWIARSAYCLISARGDTVAYPDTPQLSCDEARLLAGGAATFLGASPDSAVYVMFTSGSTGRPKGVTLSHRVLINTLYWMSDHLELSPGDRVLQSTPFDFDPSAWELFLPLIFGRTMVVARPGGHRDPAYLAELIRRERVGLLHFVPAMVTPFLAVADGGRLPTLKHVVCSGEALSGALAGSFRDAFPSCTLHNFYGPVEAAIDVTAHRCVAGDGGATPIGRATPNVQLYLCDPMMRLVPPGYPGELFIGGRAPARGYLGLPALTALRFVPDPFGSEPGGRLYRSGDLCRFLEKAADPPLLFIGRVDRQVKLKGVRFELEEIERLLRRHPKVRSAAVTLQAADQRLGAHIIAGDEAPDPAELRAYLEARLPRPAVPSAWRFVAEFPQTSSGKVDYKALPHVGGGRVRATAAAPRNARESALVAAWTESLGVAQVGVHDNFFALGGDSILAIGVVSRLYRRGWRCRPDELFHHPTIALLGPQLRRLPRNEAAPEPVVGEGPLLPIHHMFTAMKLPDPHHYNQSQLLITEPGLVPAVLERALEALAAHHDALRARLDLVKSAFYYPAADAVGPLPIYDLSALREQDRAGGLTQIAAQIQRSICLSAGGLLRAAYFHMGGREPGRILLVVHHLAVDGVSWRILLEDLAEIYRTALLDRPLPRLLRTHSVQAWAQKLQEQAGTEQWLAGRHYWLNREEVPALPRDKAGEPVVGTIHFEVTRLDRESCDGLARALNQSFGAGLEEGLACALLLSFAAWTGEPTLLCDWERHGRETAELDLDLSRTVGWFTQVFPVVLRTADAADPVGTLRSVKEILGGVPHRGLGYGMLRYLCPREDVRAAFAAQQEPEVCFNYLGRGERGRLPAPFLGYGREGQGPLRGREGTRPYLIEINAFTRESGLEVVWSYSRAVHDRETIAERARAFADFLVGLKQACAQQPVSPPNEPAGVAADHAATYPLLPMQRCMLFTFLAEPASDIYFIQKEFVKKGPLDVARLETAWRLTVERNPALRTIFQWRGLPEARQVVLAQFRLPWTFLDLAGLDPSRRREALREFLASDRRRRFDPTRVPPVRLALLRMGAHEFRLIWSFHHILLDGWSAVLLSREAQSCYQTLLRGAAPPPRKANLLPAYLAHFKAWDGAAAHAYWRDRLSGLEPQLHPRRQESGGGRILLDHRVRLPEGLSREARDFVRREGLTMSALLQGVWALMTARVSRRDDVVFGMAVSGRSTFTEGAEDLVGMLINTLPVRIEMDYALPSAEWLRRLARDQATRERYGLLSLAEIKGYSEAGAEPLFDTLLGLENFPTEAGSKGGRDGFVPALAHEKADYALTVIFSVGTSIALRFGYDCRLYEREEVGLLADHFQTILEGLTAHPHLPTSEIPMVTEADLHQLNHWGVAPASPAFTPVVAQFEFWAEQFPDTPAIVEQQRVTSYGALARMVNGSAHRLRRRGVRGETVVAVLFEKSALGAACILATLKAGASLLWLDPAWPPARLRTVLAATKPLLVMVSAGLRRLVPPDVACLVMEPGAEKSAPFAPVAVDTRQRAYLMYTSGSTGSPKGAEVTHGGLANLVRAAHCFEVGHGSRMLWFAPPGFDASIFEFFLALGRGASLCVADPVKSLPGRPLYEAMKTQRVTHAVMTPSTLATLPDAPLNDLSHLITAGEACTAELAGRWGRERVLFNAYGPVEGCICATASRVAAAEAQPAIGSPLDGFSLHVLSPFLQPEPVGTVGELYLAGVALARGYLQAPAQTAGVFLPNPFGPAGSRMYRTGDLVRYRRDGQLVFCGRADNQLNPRGQRMEPAEVERLLETHGDVARALVAPLTVANESVLAAYVVPAAGVVGNAEGLRDHLGGLLPKFMIPVHYFFLETMPLTHNGKIDRKALARIQPKRREAPAVAPNLSKGERLVAEVWSQVLGERVWRPDDNFYDVGGHSLKLVGVQELLSARLGRSLPLAALFNYPTLASLARYLEGGRTASKGEGKSRAAKRLAQSDRRRRGRKG